MSPVNEDLSLPWEALESNRLQLRRPLHQNKAQARARASKALPFTKLTKASVNPTVMVVLLPPQELALWQSLRQAFHQGDFQVP